MNPIDRAFTEVAVAKAHLAGLLAALCPGSHRYVQHRDRRQPWCHACGYAEDGIRVKELP